MSHLSHLSGFLNRGQDALDKDSSGGVPGLPKALVFGKGGRLVGCGIVWETVLETNICEEEMWESLGLCPLAQVVRICSCSPRRAFKEKKSQCPAGPLHLLCGRRD